jgi:hypothetical protein
MGLYSFDFFLFFDTILKIISSPHFSCFNSSPTPLQLHVLFLLFIMFILFILFILQLTEKYCLYVYGCATIWWYMGNPPGATSLKETESPPQQTWIHSDGVGASRALPSSRLEGWMAWSWVHVVEATTDAVIRDCNVPVVVWMWSAIPPGPMELNIHLSSWCSYFERILNPGSGFQEGYGMFLFLLPGCFLLPDPSRCDQAPAFSGLHSQNPLWSPPLCCLLYIMDCPFKPCEAKQILHLSLNCFFLGI